MTNTTTSSPTPNPTYNSIPNDESKKESNLYEIVFYGVMGSLLIIFGSVCINEIYGPFFGIERSSPVLPEGEQLPPESWSFMSFIHSILDIRDAYNAEVNSLGLNAITLNLEEGAQQIEMNGETS